MTTTLIHIASLEKARSILLSGRIGGLTTGKTDDVFAIAEYYPHFTRPALRGDWFSLGPSDVKLCFESDMPVFSWRETSFVSAGYLPSGIICDMKNFGPGGQSVIAPGSPPLKLFDVLFPENTAISPQDVCWYWSRRGQMVKADFMGGRSGVETPAYDRDRDSDFTPARLPAQDPRIRRI